jgi:hypothetical protein
LPTYHLPHPRPLILGVLPPKGFTLLHFVLPPFEGPIGILPCGWRGLMQSFRSSWGCEIELEAMATIKALRIKGGTQGQGQNALIALCPHHDNQGMLIWIDIHGSPSLYCSCEWDLSHNNANSCKIFHVTIPCQLCLGEVPQLTRGVPTEVCWGRGMVRP